MVFDFLTKNKLDISKLCAFGSDGASVMTGRENVVAARLKELVCIVNCVIEL